MKRNIFFKPFVYPFIFGLLLMTGCQPSKETIREVQTPMVSQTGGTDNTGGGNGVNHKPLDSYIQNVTEVPSYTKYVWPIIGKLKSSFPRLAADFYYLHHVRSWYFIPIDLNEISSNAIGAYGKTDQFAIQDLNKIWIDTRFFDQMSELDQAILIVHETMMGVKLMAYKHRQDLCLAKAYVYALEDETLAKFRDEQNQCRKIYPILPGTVSSRFNLTADDYDFIRKLTHYIFDSKFDPKELQDVMESYKFRDYSD